MSVRVLIVDDREPFRLAARMVVDATEGFEVVGEAESGEESVERAHELSPDLVLMDVNLLDQRSRRPGGSSLRAGARSSSCCSTYEEEEYAPRAAECGAAAYLPKAVFGPDRLEQAWAAATSS